MNWRRRKKLAFLCFGGGLLALTALFFLIFACDKPIEEPSFQGRLLSGWLKATPPSNQVGISYRRAALLAMGDSAVQYLDYAITHPRRMIRGHGIAFDKLVLQLGDYVPQLLPPMEQLITPPPNRISFQELLFCVRLVGTNGCALAPDVVRLWESNGQLEYSADNGFPLALAELGNTSPEVLDSLHRHFTSPNRLHRAMCAFAAWKLNPGDTQAISMLRTELTSTDQDVQPRYSLLETLARWGGTNVALVLPETRALIVAPIPSIGYQHIVADAAARILKTDETRR